MDILKTIIKYIIYPKPFILIVSLLILFYLNISAKYKIQKILDLCYPVYTGLVITIDLPKKHRNTEGND